MKKKEIIKFCKEKIIRFLCSIGIHYELKLTHDNESSTGYKCTYCGELIVYYNENTPRDSV